MCLTCSRPARCFLLSHKMHHMKIKYADAFSVAALRKDRDFRRRGLGQIGPLSGCGICTSLDAICAFARSPHFAALGRQGKIFLFGYARMSQHSASNLGGTKPFLENRMFAKCQPAWFKSLDLSSLCLAHLMKSLNPVTRYLLFLSLQSLGLGTSLAAEPSSRRKQVSILSFGCGKASYGVTRKCVCDPVFCHFLVLSIYVLGLRIRDSMKYYNKKLVVNIVPRPQEKPSRRSSYEILMEIAKKNSQFDIVGYFCYCNLCCFWKLKV